MHVPNGDRGRNGSGKDLEVSGEWRAKPCCSEAKPKQEGQRHVPGSKLGPSSGPLDTGRKKNFHCRGKR